MRGALAVLIALWLIVPAQAQTLYPFVVTSCGGQSFTVGQSKPLLMDTTGNLCTSASGGGGGGSVTQGTVPWVVSGQGTAGTAATGVVTVQGIASMTKLLVTPDSVALPANQSVNVNQIAGASVDPCFGSVKSFGDFESGTSGGSIITAVSAKKAYVCQVSIVTSTAANVSIVEGTGSSVCTAGTPSGDYLNTGTTAANGASFAANSGVSVGAGSGTIFANATANQNTCVVFTTTNSPQVNVHVAYVQQ